MKLYFYPLCVLTNVCVLPLRQLRVSKEQEHFLVLPDGLAYSEVTGSSLVSKTNPSQDEITQTLFGHCELNL